MLTINSTTLQTIQDHLALILHAHRCHQQEQTTKSHINCLKPDCARMRTVLEHMTQCINQKNCSFPSCAKSRSIIFHWKHCSEMGCPICDLSQHISRNTWRKQVQQNDRNFIVEKIIAIVLSLFQLKRHSMWSDQLNTVKREVVNLEIKAFNAATSHYDYGQCLVNQCHQIRMKCEERKLLKQQQCQVNLQANLTTSNVDVQEVVIENCSENLHATCETSSVGTGLTSNPASTNTINTLLPQYRPTFLVDNIRIQMAPILEELLKQKDIRWFCFSEIDKKLKQEQYTTPMQFYEDVQRIFDNARNINAKTCVVYKAATKLSELFTEKVNPIMKAFGYCCGHRYVFLPYPMICYGGDRNRYCSIPRNTAYFVYTDATGHKYTFCRKCFRLNTSTDISISVDSSETLKTISKKDCKLVKNDDEVSEVMVNCIRCSRYFHAICVLYHKHIWPDGYVCKQCMNNCSIQQTNNQYAADKLPSNKLAASLENRVNAFIRKECDGDTGRVTIRVLAASDRVCEIKPRFKKHFGSQVPAGYPYRTKAIFAFQEVEGVDVVLFGMHVQEYDSRCPGPNAKRVYISYLDSVHYFQPKQKRTSFYYEILIGYLEHVRNLGFAYAHIWACPPSEGDDYIFYCHPVEQRVPKPKRLQEWYKTMLDQAKKEDIVDCYKDIKDYADDCIKKAIDIPYFEGDFWPNKLESLLEAVETINTHTDNVSDNSAEFQEPINGSNKRPLCSTFTQRKKNSRNITSGTTMNEDSFVSQVHTIMTEQRKSFIVVYLKPVADSDPLISCSLIESRHEFLNFAYTNRFEFSTLRRAKHSTMALLIEHHLLTRNKITYICNGCENLCDRRYHCTVCQDFNLCSKCYSNDRHEHPMEYKDDQ